MICTECGTENSRWAIRCARCGHELPRGKERWMLVGAVVFAAAALAIVLVRADLARRFAASPRWGDPTAARPAAAADPLAALPFEIDPPGLYWKVESPEKAGEAFAGIPAKLALTRTPGHAFGMVLAEPAPFTAEGLATVALERLKGRSEGFSLQRRQAAEIGGLPAEQAEFTLRSGGLDIRYVATYVVAEGTGYQVLFWTLGQDIDALRPEFQQTLRSWRWKNLPVRDALPVPDGGPSPEGP